MTTLTELQTALAAILAARTNIELDEDVLYAIAHGSDAGETSLVTIRNHATSASSVAVGAGAKTFVTQAGKGWAPGDAIVITKQTDVTVTMTGTVTSYSGTSLVVNIGSVTGTGTHAAWHISGVVKSAARAAADNAANTLRTRWFKSGVAAGTLTLSGLDDDGQVLSFVPGAEVLYASGVRLVRGKDYTTPDGATIAFVSADILTSTTDIEIDVTSRSYASIDARYAGAGDRAMAALDGEEGVSLHFISRGMAIRDYARVLTNMGWVEYLATFLRGSTATFVDSEGIIQTQAAGAMRYTHHPLTLAPAGYLHEGLPATNVFLQSSDISVSPHTLTNATVGTASGRSIFGAATYQKMVENTTTSVTHAVSQNIAVTSGTLYLMSRFVRAEGRTRCDMSFGTGGFGATVRATYDLVAKTATLNVAGTGGWCGIEEWSGGWFRVWLAAQATATQATAFSTTLVDGSGNRSYTGDGTSGLGIAGAQVEVVATSGARPSSHIPTTTVAVTRQADQLTLAIAGTPIVARRGTMQVTATPRDLVAAQTLAAVFGTNKTTNAAALQLAGGGALTGQIYSATALVANLALGTPVVGAEIKCSLAWKADDASADSNVSGVTTQTDTSMAVPAAFDTIEIGAGFHGTIKEIKVINRRISDASVASYKA